MVVRRARGRTAGASPPSCSTASEETAHGVHAPAGGVLARRPEVIATVLTGVGVLRRSLAHLVEHTYRQHSVFREPLAPARGRGARVPEVPAAG